jgi:hypothetical protein
MIKFNGNLKMIVDIKTMINRLQLQLNNIFKIKLKENLK